MPIRRSSIVLIGLGVLFIVLAAVARFWVVPSVSKLPESLDVTNTYQGSGTLLNAEAVAAGDMQNAIATNVPVEVVRHTYVESTSGDTAIVHDNFTIKAPGGVELPTNHTYAVDRKTMEQAPAPGDQAVEAHNGITIALPIDPDRDKQYELYDFATQNTFPMVQSDPTTVHGRDVYNYTVTAQGPLKDTAISSALPPALPKPTLAQIIALLPPEAQAPLNTALPTLPDLVPINYTANSTIGVSIDQTLGTPVDGALKQQVTANIAVGENNLPLMPILALDTTLTDDSVTSAADTASTTSTQLSLIKLWVPLVLTILGLALIVLGVIRRKPRTPTNTPPTTNDANTATVSS